jgi:hypothetical protein
MKKFVRELYGNAASTAFSNSDGWFFGSGRHSSGGFAGRYRIRLKCGSNKKQESAAVRAVRFRRFHARLRLRLRRGKEVDAKYGRWLPRHRYGTDQVPINLRSGSKKTYADCGEGRVYILGAGDKENKRFATLQLTSRFDNLDPPRKKEFLASDLQASSARR